MTCIVNCSFTETDIGCGVHEFTDSTVESVSIPATVIDIKEEFCEESKKLTNIKIDPENPCYSYYDDRYIIGKSTKNADNYDTLVFASRDITIMQKKKLL